jgi:hypothetical protein
MEFSFRYMQVPLVILAYLRFALCINAIDRSSEAKSSENKSQNRQWLHCSRRSNVIDNVGYDGKRNHEHKKRRQA